jgi:hypothetical protein
MRCAKAGVAIASAATIVTLLKRCFMTWSSILAALVNDGPPVTGDLRVDELGAQRLEPAEGALFVSLDQPRIAGDIRRRNRREATFDPLMLTGTHRGSPLHRPSHL